MQRLKSVHEHTHFSLHLTHSLDLCVLTLFLHLIRPHFFPHQYTSLRYSAVFIAQFPFHLLPPAFFFFPIKVAPLTNDLDVTLPKNVCVTVWDMLAQDSWFLIRDGDEFCMYHIVTCRNESRGRQEWRQPYPSPQCCAENLWGMEQRAGKSPGGTLLESFTVHWGVGTH